MDDEGTEQHALSNTVVEHNPKHFAGAAYLLHTATSQHGAMVRNYQDDTSRHAAMNFSQSVGHMNCLRVHRLTIHDGRSELVRSSVSRLAITHKTVARLRTTSRTAIA